MQILFSLLPLFSAKDKLMPYLCFMSFLPQQQLVNHLDFYETEYGHVKFEVLMAATIKISIFRDVIPCGLLAR
jgi:hypothetical protein